MDFLSLALGLVSTIRKKVRKQFRRQEPVGPAVQDLRHELGAMSALTKSMERKAKRGRRVDHEDMKELAEHIDNADHIAKRLGIKVVDPPFDFKLMSEEALRKTTADNEPALALAEVMFRSISREAFRVASEL